MQHEDSYISSGSYTPKKVLEKSMKKRVSQLVACFGWGDVQTYSLAMMSQCFPHFINQFPSWPEKKTHFAATYTPPAKLLRDVSRGNVHKDKTTSNNHPHDCTSLLIESLCLLKMLGKSVLFFGGEGRGWTSKVENTMKQMDMFSISIKEFLLRMVLMINLTTIENMWKAILKINKKGCRYTISYSSIYLYKTTTIIFNNSRFPLSPEKSL